MKVKGVVKVTQQQVNVGRFEADVVEGRRQATLHLLRFIGQHSPLFTSEPFTTFFQVGLPYTVMQDCFF